MKKNVLFRITIFLLLFCIKTFTVNAQTQDQSATPSESAFVENYDIGQSFTSGFYGTFHSIQFRTHSSQPLVGGLTFYLYSGDTVSGTPLFSTSITQINAGSNTFTVLINTPIISTVGGVYTWRLIDNGAVNFSTIKMLASSSVGYTGGSAWLDRTNYNQWDVWFRSFVNVQTPPPTAVPTQAFCNSATFANLQATGTAIKWYATPVFGVGSAIPSTTNLTSGTYYASQTVSGLESVTLTPVTAVVNTTPSAAPTATSPQSFPATSTVANLTAVGTGIKWYAATSGGTALAPTVNLASGTTYYASQTISACESASRVAVVANVAAPLQGASLKFDGTNDSVTLPTSIGNALSAGTEMTIEYWFKGTNVQSAVRIQNAAGYIVAGWMAGTGTPQFLVSSDGGVSGVNCGSAASINDNNWHHLAFVWKKNVVFATYLDGVLQNSRVAANVNLPAVAGAITYLGQSNVGNEFMNGNLDEVRIWNRALSACEINTNRNCELPTGQTNLLAYYKFNEGNANFTNTITSLTDSSGNSRNGTFNAFAFTGSNSNFITPGGVVSGTTCVAFNGGTTAAPTTANATQNFANGTTIGGLTAVGTSLQWYAAASGGTALLSSVMLVSGTTYYASQTINSCESASRVAVLANVAAPLPGASLNFDGANDNVTLPIFNFGGNQLTIEAWVKPINFATTFSEIARQGASTPDYLLAFQNNGTKLTFGVRTGTAYDDLQVAITPASFLDGNWHHVAAVYDGATRKIYVDGILLGTNTKTGTITAIETTNTIGNVSINGNEPFNGNIDELRFWNRALSGCEIITNRNCELPTGQTNLLAYYKFNNGIANVANAGVIALVDSSGNNRNGSLNNFGLAAGISSNWATLGGVVTGTTCSAFAGSSTPVPTAAPNQTICGGLTVANLVASGSNIKWYNAATEGSEFSANTVLINGTSYFASQTIAGCESNSRTAVLVSVTTPPVAPVAIVKQNTISSGTIASLTATPLAGGTIKWYTALSGGTPLVATTTLVNGSTYYATQTIGGCESISRTAVIVSFTFTGSSLNFDGANDVITVPAIPLGEQKMTIELWVKPNNFNNNTSMLVYREGHPNHSAGSGSMYYLAFTNFGTNLAFGLKVGLQFCCPSFPNHVNSSQLTVPITPATFLDGNWHHIAAVYDGEGQTRKIYVDGVLAGSGAAGGSVFEFIPQTPITIGNVNNNSGFNGSIDEVRLWDRALGACEINNNKNCELPLGQIGLKGYFKCNDGDNNAVNSTFSTLLNSAGITNGTLLNFALTGTTSNWTNAAGVTTGSNCTPFTGGSTPAPTATSPQNVIANATVANLTASGTAIKWYATATGGTVLAANFALTNGNTYYATQTLDFCESSSRTAVVVNIAGTVIASSLNFDGANDSVSLPVSIANDLSNGTEMTIEYWFKGTNVQSAVRMQSGASYIVAGWMAGTGTPQFLVSTDGGVNGVNCGSAASINDNNWHHLAFVWKKNTVFATYLDGVLQNSRVAANVNLPVFSNAITFLGQSDVGTEFINGNLDEVRIWNRALSDCEINTNRNCELPTSGLSNLLAYYKFNEGNGDAGNTNINVTDSSGNSRNGTLNNFALAGTASNWSTLAGVVSGTTCTQTVFVPTPAPTAAAQTFYSAYASDIVATGTNFKYYDSAALNAVALANSKILATGTYYVSQTVNGCEGPRIPIAITIESTSWDGTAWTNGLPTASRGAIIEGNYSQSVNLNVLKLEVRGTAIVSVPSDFDFTVTNEVEVASTASLTFENNANLLQTTNALNVGNITSKRNTAVQRLAYTNWSSPVAAQNALAFSPLTSISPTIRFYTYNEVGNAFAELADPNTTNMIPAIGYSIRAPNTFPASSTQQFVGAFTGVPNNGNYSAVATYTSATQGYNLVGNPYPSTMLASEFFNANSTVTALHFWNNNVLDLTSGANYATRNLTSGTRATSDPLGLKIPNDFIAVGQGFFTRVNAAGTLNFTNAMRSSDNSSAFFFRNATTDKHLFKLNLLSPTKTYNQMAVGYLAGATQGLDNQYDATPFSNSPIMLTSLINNVNYIIQGKSLPFINTDSVQLGFKTNVAGNYAINSEAFEGVFANNQNIFLKDNLVGITHNIKQSPYSFTTNVGTFNSRFEIVYVNGVLGIENPNFDANNVFVFVKSNNININSGKINMKNIQVFDIRGRLVFDKKEVNATTFEIENLKVEQAVLLVKITSENGQIVSKKIVY